MSSEKAAGSNTNADCKNIVNPRSRMFRPCLTCRRRKISCDKSKPKCNRCAQTGYQCEGYGEERHFVYVTPTRAPASSTEIQKTKKVTLRSSRQLPPSQQVWDQQQQQQQLQQPQQPHQLQHQLQKPQFSTMVNLARANRLQIVSYFVDRYLPDRSLQQKEDKTALTWIRGLPQSLGKQDLLDKALLALSLAYIGDFHQNYSILRQGERFYNEALMQMRARLRNKLIDEGLLASCMCMSMYELFHTTCGGTQGWMFHVKGACRLLELRGPPSAEYPLDMNLFRRIRAAALWDSYGTGKPTFLSKREWRGLSDIPYDQLMDILVQLPSLLARADQIESSPAETNHSTIAASTQELLWECRLLGEELVTWYTVFESKEKGPLFSLEREEQHPYLDPKSDLNNLFPESVNFQTPYIAQILMLYWYGQVLVHSVLSRVYGYIREQAQAQPVSPITSSQEIGPQAHREWNLIDDETLANTETLGEYFASKICQAMAGCGRNSLQGYGFQIALVPLWAAQEYYLTRSERKYMWCRTVLTNFSTRGFVLAQNLGSMPLRLYPGRHLEAYSTSEQDGL